MISHFQTAKQRFPTVSILHPRHLSKRRISRSSISGVLLLFVMGCDQQETGQKPAASTAEEDAEFVRMATAGRMLSDLQVFLASNDPAPKRFTFDRLDFSPGSATVRPIDEQTIYSVANTLQGHPDVRVRIVGYDDGIGTRKANPALATRRASAILTALRKAGVASSRLEGVRGRQGYGPRVTELVVLQK